MFVYFCCLADMKTLGILRSRFPTLVWLFYSAAMAPVLDIITMYENDLSWASLNKSTYCDYISIHI
jgi:hypothetical protein